MSGKLYTSSYLIFIDDSHFLNFMSPIITMICFTKFLQGFNQAYSIVVIRQCTWQLTGPGLQCTEGSMQLQKLERMSVHNVYNCNTYPTSIEGLRAFFLPLSTLDKSNCHKKE